MSHQLLWDMLLSTGVSTKLVNTIKSLYDHAVIRVRSEETLSDEFNVSEGVLQGESLSALLFILFISDFETYMRKSGLEGINIDGLNDLLLVLFVDDTVRFARSYANLNKLLGLLEKYCLHKGLNIKTSKTKIMIFKEKGVPKGLKKMKFRLCGKEVERVKSFVYLGVTINSTAQSSSALLAVIGKAKVATESVINVVKSSKTASWVATMKLSQSMVTSTGLYAFPAWGLPGTNRN